MQLVAPPVVRQGRIIAVGQANPRRHRSVLHAPHVTTRMVAATAPCRPRPPFDTVDYTQPVSSCRPVSNQLCSWARGGRIPSMSLLGVLNQPVAIEVQPEIGRASCRERV